MHIHARNAADALSQSLSMLLEYGKERPSRNGPVVAMDEPVTITYNKPDERVLLSPERDANPFFHLYECLWMLAGRRDVKSVAAFVPGMRNYSDNGMHFNAAYGYRWRRHFGFDQLNIVVEKLRQPNARDDRRVFMTMWAPSLDVKPLLDVPCNIGVSFRCRSGGELDMTVFNRSNDLILGALGANVVHMSFLHEYVARATGIPLGRYHQITNDLHVYLEHEKTTKCRKLAAAYLPENDPYVQEVIRPYPIMDTSVEDWEEDLKLFMQYGNVVAIRDRFFRRVAGPMMAAHAHYSRNVGEDRYVGALEIMEQCIGDDWRRAGTEWVQRRYDNWKEKTR